MLSTPAEVVIFILQRFLQISQ